MITQKLYKEGDVVIYRSTEKAGSHEGVGVVLSDSGYSFARVEVGGKVLSVRKDRLKLKHEPATKSFKEIMRELTTV